MKQWLVTAAIDWCVIVAAFALAAIDWRLAILSWLVIGNRQHALAILGHDGAHRLVCYSRELNDFLTNALVFYPLCLSLKYYRRFHFEHHRNTNNDKDPEVRLKKIGPLPMVAPFSQAKVFSHAALDLLGAGVPQLLAFMWEVRPKKAVQYMQFALAAALVTALCWLGLWWVPALWFGSLLTSFWACFRLRVWSEHVGLGEGETLQFTPNWWQKVLFLPHNSWCHHWHHEKPGIPFYELPSLGRFSETLCQARAKESS